MYYTINGDIISSKAIKDRSTIQSKLQLLLDEINITYKSQMEKKLDITLGDEFQGLFTSFEPLFEVIHKIMIEMHPVTFRFGIGVGDLLVNDGGYFNTYKSDGDVWWNSRSAVDDIKVLNKTNKKIVVSNIRLKTGIAPLDDYSNATLNMCYAINKRWTDSQRELIHFIFKEYGFSDQFTNKELASKYNQAESTIYDKLKAAQFYYYIDIFKKLVLMIEDLRKDVS